MSKIPKELDDPIDNIIVQAGENIIPWFKNTGHTPNMLTMYSFVLGIYAVLELRKGHLKTFAALYFLSYAFDCWDGNMARKYKMTSKFGDLLDHATDYIIGIAIFYVVFTRYSNKLEGWHFALFAVTTALLAKHTGCIQQIQKKSVEGGESLDAFKQFCSDPNDIHWTRYFGAGMFNVFLILFILIIAN